MEPLFGGGKDGQVNRDDTPAASGQRSYEAAQPAYEAPTVDELGSLADLTGGEKFGPEPDAQGGFVFS